MVLEHGDTAAILHCFSSFKKERTCCLSYVVDQHILIQYLVGIPHLWTLNTNVLVRYQTISLQLAKLLEFY
jgi:hypothetical protein